MNERQKRLIEVYEHLRRHFGIHTKTGFAEAVHFGRTSMSAALNGNEDYLTDNLFKNICEAYPGIFNLDYLLNGKGQLLTIQEEVKATEIEQPTLPSSFDFSLIIEHAVKAATAYADKTIANLENQLADKEKQLAQRDEYIAILRQRIEQLEAALNAQPDETGKFLFPQGVADKNEEVRARV